MKKSFTFVGACSALVLMAMPLFSLEFNAEAGITQDGVTGSISISTGNTNSNTNQNQAQKTPAPLPVSYNSLSLGMNVDAVKKELSANPIYGYKGERDVSLLPTQNRILIESSGLSFLERSWFQFYEDSLYTMIFKLDSDRMDFYSVFRTLQEKYGEPTSLDPQKIVWKDERVTLSLERPLMLKFIDTQVFKQVQDNAVIEKNYEELTRKGFLDTL